MTDVFDLIPAHVRQKADVQAAMRTLLGTDGKKAVIVEEYVAAVERIHRALEKGE